MAKEFTDKKSVVLQNKDIDGGIADNRRRLTLPKNTTSNLADLTRKEATLAWDTTLDQVVVDNGSGFSPIGGGGGSGTVTQVNTGTGLSGGPITTTGTINLANTAVTPGSYTRSNITVDAQGRITSAANGSADAVSSVNGEVGVVVLDSDDIGAASQALDNLVDVAINTHLIPDTDFSYTLGTFDHRWSIGYIQAMRNSVNNTVVDFEDLALLDSGGTDSIQWGNRALIDSSLNPVVDWEARELYNTDGDLIANWADTNSPTDGQILTGHTDGTITWEDSGGGSFPSLAPDGSAAAPSYSFSNDTDCGLWRAGANDISLAIGGASITQWGVTYFTASNSSNITLGHPSIYWVTAYINNVDAKAFTLERTITAGGTTGDQVINKVSGTVNFAAAATSLTVTNSLVNTSSIVYAVVRTADASATIMNVVPGSGSFVINLGAAAAAETSVGFFVTN